MDEMSVLVIGGCGKVGHLVAEPLWALDRYITWYSFDPAPEHVCPWAVHIPGDATDLGSLFQTARGCDVLLYMPMGRLSDEVSLFQVAVQGFYNTLLVAKVCGKKPVIFASSISLGSTASTNSADLWVSTESVAAVDSPYCVSKLAGEAVGRHFARSFGMSVLVLRLGTPMTDIEAMHKRDEEKEFPNVLAASDLASALRNAVLLKGHIGFDVLNIAGDLTGKHIDLSRTKELLGWSPAR